MSFRRHRRPRNRNTAQSLNSFGQGVHNLGLLAKMFVEEEMKLIERRSGGLPMVLFVEITQGTRVRENLIKSLDTPRRTLWSSEMGRLAIVRTAELRSHDQRGVVCVDGFVS